ncbi:MAG TPA: hypothetical protein VD884_13320 [Ohtaekwangia sp.]|nr:hypothetical protein [Ohtaekwangia sp.]
MVMLGKPTVLYTVTDEQLKELIVETIRQWESRPKPDKEQPLTRKEAAKYLRCHVSTLDRKWKKLRHNVDGQFFWLESELAAHIKKS